MNAVCGCPLNLHECKLRLWHTWGECFDPFAKFPNLINLTLDYCKFGRFKTLKISGAEMLNLIIKGMNYWSTLLPQDSKIMDMALHKILHRPSPFRSLKTLEVKLYPDDVANTIPVGVVDDLLSGSPYAEFVCQVPQDKVFDKLPQRDSNGYGRYGEQQKEGQDCRRRRRRRRDRLSDLPDTILQHILSSLDTKLAVQTSILSQKLRHVWACVPDLNFTSESFTPLIHF
ncbi:hypothetical protein Tsubulata_034777 [Turnera subulata]|uniref:F-box domain-containing protein n=1 Tax=Turnera subulata TaxID=218843 RepID=A0A9Q0F8A9_9ROSI|nr:hypothetical protein Tsubulata_034777 [Turnera subulata]